MTERRYLLERWHEYRPSKRLWLFSSIGVVAATIAVGFGYAGWMTHSSAEALAQEAAREARARLAASVCVERYSNGEEFNSRLAQFKDATSYDQERLIEKGNWATLPGVEEPVTGASDLCADRVADLEPSKQRRGDTQDENKGTSLHRSRPSPGRNGADTHGPLTS